MSVNIRPSHKPSGPPTYAPTTRPVYRGGSSSSAAYPLAFSTLGLAGSGFVVDGLESRVATTPTDPLNNLCVASESDPVGWFEDLSGNGTDVTQAVSPNKGLYIVNGGVKGFRAGTISAVRRWLEAGINVPAAFSLYMVTTRLGTHADTVNLAMLEPASPFLQFYRANNARQVDGFDNGSAGTAGSALGNNLLISVKRAGTGAGETELSIYSSSSLEGQNAMTMASTYTGKTAQFGGWSGFDYGPADIFAIFYYEGSMTAGQHAAVLSRFQTIRGMLA